MSTLEALYFPGTELHSGSQFPVFLLLNKVHLLQPVEEENTSADTADIFTTRGLCQAHTPAPLGENRNRFLRLIRDIRERKDDYAAQLSALTVASLSQKKSTIEDTPQGIISSLIGSQGVQAEVEQEDDVELWQARLLLKIGEILDREEEEVAMQMALLDDEEEGLFKALQGELDDEEESLIGELKQLQENISRPAVSTIKNRLSAWSKLYQAGTFLTQSIWLTQMEEAGDILLERYQEKTSLPPTLLVQFPLPANIGWGKEEVSEELADFHADNRALIAAIAAAFEQKDSATLADLSAEWSRVLDASYPADRNGRTVLEIYTLADSPCDTLIGSKSSGSGPLLGIVRWQR